MTAQPGTCGKCNEHNVLLVPLHGEKGGPLWCLRCGLDWHVEHGRRRRAGRIAIKAMRLFLEAGGTDKMLDNLKTAAVIAGLGVLVAPGYDPDTIGVEVGDISADLLPDAIQLTHPDRHPPEREGLAQRVTSELLVLKPCVFPSPKPKPVEPQPRDGSASRAPDPLDDALRKGDAYPCGLCADELPMNYCSTCRGKWEERQREEKEIEAEKANQKAAHQRERRAEIKRWQARHAKPPKCPTCLKTFTPKRSDATYCSTACRQRAHRQRDSKAVIVHAIDKAQVERAIEATFLADLDNAYTTEDLCDRVFVGLNRNERKHRAAIPSAAKAV